VAVRARARLEIRRMRPDDLEEVMVIERAAFKHPWSPELFRRELEHDWSTILVAVEPLTSAPGRGTERIVAARASRACSWRRRSGAPCRPGRRS
jgi:ribosomal protein S18 acetylase RimI-like enzyme